MSGGAVSFKKKNLQTAYANLHTDQERDYFIQRYHDVISSFGGKTSYDADNRPLLVMRSNLWASGYDVDGTDQSSLVQFSGRVQQNYKQSVPRFFVLFFFQAEDGIRDVAVTGVQTCALPISSRGARHLANATRPWLSLDRTRCRWGSAVSAPPAPSAAPASPPARVAC